MTKKNIMITGTTGQQGGSVATALLDKGHQLFGLTRNPASDKAKTLSANGIKMKQGDLSDLKSLIGAFDNIDYLFLVGTPFEAGVESETLQGINAIDAAKEAGVKHILYSSVSDADKSTGIPHFNSKFLVEQHLRDSEVPFTIIAPVFFYDNMIESFVLPGLQKGNLAQAMPGNVPLQSVSVKNIGEFAGMILRDPNQFKELRINIAGDSLSGNEYAETIGTASGREINYTEVPLEQVKSWSEDMALMYDWFVKVGYSVKIEELKQFYTEVKWETFSQWASRQDWSVLEKE